MKYWKRIKTRALARSIVGQYDHKRAFSRWKFIFCINYVNCEEKSFSRSQLLLIEYFFFHKSFRFSAAVASSARVLILLLSFSTDSTPFHGGIMGEMICYLHDDRWFLLISSDRAKRAWKLAAENKLSWRNKELKPCRNKWIKWDRVFVLLKAIAPLS